MESTLLFRVQSGTVTRILIFIAFCFSTLNLSSQTKNPPGVHWKAVTFRDKNMKNQQGVTQDESADEWWYAHKNLYDNNGKQIGYVAVGYIAEFVKKADKPQIETDMRNVYNEGADSPYNPFPSTLTTLFTTVTALAGPPLPGCDEFYDVNGATDVIEANDRRTEHRGMVARLDLDGKMIWCRILTTHGEGLQEVVQEGDYIYVVGCHLGAKTVATSTVAKSFLPYNKSTQPNNYFVHSPSSPITTTPLGHMYVAKLDLDGTKIWQGLYGSENYTGNGNTAFGVYSDGRDILYNSSNGLLYALGRSTGPDGMFVAAIDPSNGNLLNKAILSMPTVTGKTNWFVYGNAICQTHPTGTMAVGGAIVFTGFADKTRGIIYSINPNLTLNTSWTSNPFVWPAENATPTHTRGATSSYEGSSSIWDLCYHSYSQDILVGFLGECYSCVSAGNQRAEGRVYRVDADYGTVSGNYGDMGPVNAFDLRVGVVETSDHGYAAVSSRRSSGSITWPSVSALVTYSNCAALKDVSLAVSNPPDSEWDGTWGTWDTDPLIVKFNNNNQKEWEWSEDVVPGRARVITPGDFKRQECMYRITEAQDKGLVISGNCSYNHDDNYMVKLFPDCNANVNYDFDQPTQTFGTDISSSIKIRGIVEVWGTLKISGNTTKVRMADSKMTGIPTYFVVKPGGKLVIEDGAEVTSIDDSECPGSMWEGIYVSGTSSLTQGSNYSSVVNQGFLSMNSATLSNARDAVTTGEYDVNRNFLWGKTGGVIYAVNSDFINNHRDIQYMKYTDPSNPNFNIGQFVKCRFLTNSVLNEGRPTGHVSMYDVSNIRFRGCEFSYNAGSAYPPEYHGYGILSCNATYEVKDYCYNALCTSSQRTTFNNLRCGIEVLNGNPLRAITVDHAIFNDVYSGLSAKDPRNAIRISAANTSKITRNEINQSGFWANGVYINISQNYAITNNTLTGVGLGSSASGILASESYGGSHRVYRNLITDYDAGITAQFNNSAYKNNAPVAFRYDGLLMNCDRLYCTFYDIWMSGGQGSPSLYSCVAQTQGHLTDPSDPPSSEAKKLVRNWYTGSCSGWKKQWEDHWSSKNIEHAAHADANTRPTGSCGNPYLIIQNSGINYSFANHCPEKELIPGEGGCGCYNCCQYSEVSSAWSNANATYLTVRSNYETELDGGDTENLLGEVTGGGSGVFDLLLEYSPYLSDTVLKAYISNTLNTSVEILEIHNANKPFTADVWNTLLERGFDTTVIADFENQQDDYPASQRSVLENEYARARADLEFIVGQKLNYFLMDSTSTSRDSALAVILNNLDLLDYAKRQAPRAYAAAGYWERAFEFADSLAGIAEFEEAMGIEVALLELDSSQSGVFRLLEDESLLQTVAEYAADSTKPGSWQARAVLNQVFGKDMHFKYPEFDAGDERLALGQQIDDEASGEYSASTTNADAFSVFPNPANGEVSLQYVSEKAEAHDLLLIDALGRSVWAGRLLSNTTMVVRTENLQAGIYFINLIKDNRHTAVKKFIIQK